MKCARYWSSSRKFKKMDCRLCLEDRHLFSNAELAGA